MRATSSVNSARHGLVAKSPRPGFCLPSPQFLQGERRAIVIDEPRQADLVMPLPSEVGMAQSPALLPCRPNGMPFGRFASRPDQTNSAR
jgi:hypothetical protein